MESFSSLVHFKGLHGWRLPAARYKGLRRSLCAMPPPCGHCGSLRRKRINFPVICVKRYGNVTLFINNFRSSCLNSRCFYPIQRV